MTRWGHPFKTYFQFHDTAPAKKKIEEMPGKRKGDKIIIQGEKLLSRRKTLPYKEEYPQTLNAESSINLHAQDTY